MFLILNFTYAEQILCRRIASNMHYAAALAVDKLFICRVRVFLCRRRRRLKARRIAVCAKSRYWRIGKFLDNLPCV